MKKDTMEEYKKYAAIILLSVNEFTKEKDSSNISIFEKYDNFESRVKLTENFLKCTSIKTDSINYTDLWKDFIASVENPVIWRQTLKYLKAVKDIPDSHIKIGDGPLLREYFGLRLFPNILIQFSFVAMFVGVFLQFMLSERAVNDPM